MAYIIAREQTNREQKKKKKLKELENQRKRYEKRDE